jgi:hypothetical protein
LIRERESALPEKQRRNFADPKMRGVGGEGGKCGCRRLQNSPISNTADFAFVIADYTDAAAARAIQILARKIKTRREAFEPVIW